MVRRSWARRRNVQRLIQCFLAVVFIWTVVDILRTHLALERRESRGDQDESKTYTLGSESIYIASIHWNNEAILKSPWIPALLSEVQKIGRERVSVSSYASGNWDDTRGVLAHLATEFENARTRKRIGLDSTTHADEISKPSSASGWITIPRGKVELRRIPYLAPLRNRVLEPLLEMQDAGERFEKILFERCYTRLQRRSPPNVDAQR